MKWQSLEGALDGAAQSLGGIRFLQHDRIWIVAEYPMTIPGCKDVRDKPCLENFDDRHDPAAVAQSIVDNHQVRSMHRRRPNNCRLIVDDRADLMPHSLQQFLQEHRYQAVIFGDENANRSHIIPYQLYGTI